MNKYLEQEVKALLRHRPKSWNDLGDPDKYWATGTRLLNS